MVLYDARGNELKGSLDIIGNETFTDGRTAGATLAAANAEIVMDLNGSAVAVFDIRTGAMAGTLVFEGTIDNANYFPLPAIIPQTQGALAAVVIATTHAQMYLVNVAGFKRVRCRVSAYTSGNVVVVARASSAEYATQSFPQPSPLQVVVTAAANTSATITLPAAGAGLFHYITYLKISRNATAALPGTATLVITSTNLNSWADSVGNAMIAGGTQIDFDQAFPSPVKSQVANTPTTIVMPAPGAAVLWRGICHYYVGA